MKVGLYDIDSKIPNLALMKLSAFHKSKGDTVEFYSPLFHNSYDKIYASKVFKFTDPQYLRKSMISGGSGIDLKIKLTPEIEHIYPDYELYGCNYALGFITRGCIRKCGFCIVPEKEGKIHKNADLEEFCKDQKDVMLLDNNILGYPDHMKELEILRDSKKCIDFNQGLDIRLITLENAEILKQIRLKTLRFALDDCNLIPLVEKKLEILNTVGFKNSFMRFYVLIGFNSTPEEDMERIKYLHSKKCSIFVMPYDRSNRYQKDFARWVNRFEYKYISFEVYKKN